MEWCSEHEDATPDSEGRGKLKHNCPDGKEGKALRLYKYTCRPPATKGRGYVRTFLELSRLLIQF